MIGKTNLHELALGVTSNNAAFGPVRNPHDPSRSAGGSSGGSAVAVATGVVPIALGTDTGGSVRVPAAHCGVVGWRPTVGRWGTGRTVPISHTRDTAGVLATSVADAAVVDELVTGEPAAEPSARPLRLGVPRVGFYDDLHPQVAACAQRVLDRLADGGVDLVEVELAGAHELDAECGFPIVFFEIAQDLPAYLATLPGPERELTFADVMARVASPDVRGGLEVAAGGSFTEESYRQALTTRDRLRAAYAAALRPDSGRLDALVYPTVPLPAPPVGDDATTELNGRQVPVFLTTIRNTGTWLDCRDAGHLAARRRDGHRPADRDLAGSPAGRGRRPARRRPAPRGRDHAGSRMSGQVMQWPPPRPRPSSAPTIVMTSTPALRSCELV